MANHVPRAAAGIAATVLLATSCTAPTRPALTVYSGRSEALTQPLIEQFERESGLSVDVRYGGSAQLAATILEEGGDSPADVYYGQDAGALGALAREERLRTLDTSVLDHVAPRFRARDGRWIGTSGRVRVLAYHTDRVSESELPDELEGLTEQRFQGRVGWAPTNGSFQAFVTAIRVLDGDDHARAWLEAMVQNGTKSYRDNTPLFEALLNGEIDVGLTNHYYLFRFLKESPQELDVKNYSPRAGGAGALVNIAGAGVVDSTRNPEAAQEFIDFLLSKQAQTYFANETFEYPLVDGIAVGPLLQPISDIPSPDIDLSALDDLEGTLTLLEQVGVR